MTTLQYLDNARAALIDGPPNSRPRVIVVAFACNPNRGSEPGAGWGMVQAIAATANTTALVSPDDWDDLQEWQRLHRHPALRFVLVDHPESGHLAMRAERFVHKSLHLAYLAWLPRAGSVARQLHAEHPFDASLHAAYGSYWLPSPIVELPIPSVWGPVGGACTTPTSLLPHLGRRGLVGELWKRLVVRFGGLLPATRRTWSRATIRIAETENTRRALPRSLRADTRVINRAPLQHVPPVARGVRDRSLLFPSRLESRKGPRLAIRALARADACCRLVFVADGFERRALERLAARLGVADRVTFEGWVPRQPMLDMMANAAAVVLTGLREEGGCALSEAMQLGTPVIVLGHGGARAIAQCNTDPSRVRIIEPGKAPRVVDDLAAAMTHYSGNPAVRRDSYLDRSATESAIQQAILDAIDIGSQARLGEP